MYKSPWYISRTHGLFVALLTLALFVFAPNVAWAARKKTFELAGYGPFPELFVYPRHAGKPDPRWRSFDWKYTDTMVGKTPYRLYFYESELWAARFVSPLIEQQIRELTDIFGSAPEKRFDYVLFTGLSEFQQANIFFVSEGVRGITSTENRTMALPYTGDRQFFEHVGMHELVHQFQVQKAEKAADVNYLGVLELIPLWFIEGMAEFYSLRGLDPEGQYYMRDLGLHEKKDDHYSVPDFFESGPMNFVYVYKVGQAKIAFLESTFGTGITQNIYSALLHPKQTGDANNYFRDVVSEITKYPPERIEELWDEFITRRVKAPAARLPQELDAYEEISGIGKNFDSFAVSPSGRLIAVREIDPLSGRASITLLDQRTNEKTTVARDVRRNLLSLYFMQFPTFALTDSRIAYIVRTTEGPEIEYRNIINKNNGIDLGRAQRLELDQIGILQASSPALHPDGRLAFVGLSSAGWPNIFVADLKQRHPVLRRITDDPYMYEHLAWNRNNPQSALLASSNRTSSGKRGIVRINADTGEVTPLTNPVADQLSPYSMAEGGIVFQSWQSGSSQIHTLRDGNETRLTGAKTWLGTPVVAGGQLYAMGFKSGRYRLYRVPADKQLSIPVENVTVSLEEKQPESTESDGRRQRRPHVTPPLTLEPPWTPKLEDWSSRSIQDYKPFRTSGFNIDQIAGFVSTGSYSAIQAVFSDRMRNYEILTELNAPNDINYLSGSFLFTSYEGRTTWTLGGYRSVQPRADTTLPGQDSDREQYTRAESGVVGMFQYPLTTFSYYDLGLRLANVERRDYTDRSREAEWRLSNPSAENMVAPIFRLGYDNLLYEAVTGPLEGFSLLLESQTQYYLDRGDTNQLTRFDASSYFRIYGRTVLALEGLVAASTGVTREPFLVWGDDLMRAYVFADDRLFGTYVAAGKAELRFPVGALFKFPPLRGLAYYDYGTITDRWEDADRNTASSYGTGILLNIPPIGFAFVWSWPIETAPGDAITSPVLHFSARYLYQ